MDLSAVSDADGNYAIAIFDLTPGTYRIKTSKSGYKFVRVATVKVEENKTSRLDFTLEPTSGRVKPEKQKLQKGIKISPLPKENLATIEEKEQGKEKLLAIQEKQQGEISPPPPPPPTNDKAKSANYDTPPEVVGGFGELAKAIKYPDSAKKGTIVGTVHVGVQIDEQGKVVDVKILKSLSAECD